MRCVEDRALSNERALTVVEDSSVTEAHSGGGSVDLLGPDPAARLEMATKIASLLAPVVRDRGLASKIQGREYVLFEGWTLLGSLLGVFPATEWVHELANGFEARVVARTLGGQTVGAAHARCTRDERNWQSRDDFALASMAQTRAGAKALRMPLGFVVQLAGYEATPAEEMESVDREGSGGDLGRYAPSAPRKADGPRSAPLADSLANEKQRKLIWQRTKEKGAALGVTDADAAEALKRVCTDLGFASRSAITAKSVDTILHAISGWTLATFGEPEPTGEMETGDAAGPF